MGLQEEKALTRSTDMLASEINGEVVMMSIESGRYYGMNPTGVYIWKALENPLTVQDLLKHITDTFKLSEDQCRTEVLPFLEDMVKEKILVAQ